MWSKSKKYLLAVVAVGVLAFLVPAVAGAATVQSKICSSFVAPSLTAPASGYQTDSSSVHVAGSAEPNMTITIKNNSVDFGSAQAASSGAYALEVPLVTGANNLFATATDSCGTTKTSLNISVSRSAVQRTSPGTMPGSEPASAPAATPTQPVSPTTPVTTNRAKATPTATPITTVALIPNDTILKNPPDNVDDIKVPTSTSGENLSDSEKQLITNTKTEVNTQRTWIRGFAQPQSNVTVYVNRAIVAQVVADDVGSYGALVELKEGDNQIHVLAKCNDGQTVLRQMNIKLVKNIMPQKTAAPGRDDVVAKVTIGAIALGGIAITSAIMIHTAHLRRGKMGGKYA